MVSIMVASPPVGISTAQCGGIGGVGGGVMQPQPQLVTIAGWPTVMQLMSSVLSLEHDMPTAVHTGASIIASVRLASTWLASLPLPPSRVPFPGACPAVKLHAAMAANAAAPHARDALISSTVTRHS
jgi:hypothetical protein